jgi:hypothetical protein
MQGMRCAREGSGFDQVGRADRVKALRAAETVLPNWKGTEAVKTMGSSGLGHRRCRYARRHNRIVSSPFAAGRARWRRAGSGRRDGAPCSVPSGFLARDTGLGARFCALLCAPPSTPAFRGADAPSPSSRSSPHRRHKTGKVWRLLPSIAIRLSRWHQRTCMADRRRSRTVSLPLRMALSAWRTAVARKLRWQFIVVPGIGTQNFPSVKALPQLMQKPRAFFMQWQLYIGPWASQRRPNH